ncbi:glycosyltransferase family 2 protein [Tabrizicola sp. WMC-M-20]|nr:glycosyltransferase family 2 protein [Tabrizicola sp. WMC-M-20]
MYVMHSIIIPTKDRPALLLRAVRSASRGQGAGCEILVIDDMSTLPATQVLAGLPEFESGRVRVLRDDSSTGVSAARNKGIAAARGRLIFFLDDDDELQPGYCDRIAAGPAQQCDYGFSSYRLIRSDGTIHVPRPRFATGTIPPDAPLRKQLCGMGMGFWIHRPVAEEVGPFDLGLPINEDTDFICRLLDRNKRGWYEASPGVDVYQHDITGNLANITRRTHALERARSMLLVCERYPAMVAHLGKSYLRHCAKVDIREQALGFIGTQSDPWLRWHLWLYFYAKLFSYAALRMGKRH